MRILWLIILSPFKFVAMGLLFVTIGIFDITADTDYTTPLLRGLQKIGKGDEDEEQSGEN